MLVYTTILDHRKVIEIAAKHGVSSMVEKPLSTTVEDALAIRAASRSMKVHVLRKFQGDHPALPTPIRFSRATEARAKLGDVLLQGRCMTTTKAFEIGVAPDRLP